MTDYYFCKISGFSCSTLNDWRNHGKNPSQKKITEVCQVLHITLEEFYSEGVYAEGRSVTEIMEYKKMKSMSRRLIKIHKEQKAISVMENLLKDNA